LQFISYLSLSGICDTPFKSLAIFLLLEFSYIAELRKSRVLEREEGGEEEEEKEVGWGEKELG
jgi:hypothetical protein